MDCPDAAYTGAAIRPDATYRIRGRRSTVRYLGFQVMSGIDNSGNVVADDLDLGPDGTFEIVLSADTADRATGWPCPTGPRRRSSSDSSSTTGTPRSRPELEIECLDAAGPTGPPARPTPSRPPGWPASSRALGEFVEASVGFWLDVEEGGRAQGVNVFRQPAALTDMGAAAENVSVWGSWELDDDEALVIEVTPPEALYWSVSLGNYWWETIDYANHQSSLNGHQAVLDDDGVFRAVVAGHDPGVANWLDTAGQPPGGR